MKLSHLMDIVMGSMGLRTNWYQIGNKAFYIRNVSNFSEEIGYPC